MNGKRQVELMKCILAVGVFGLMLWLCGCSMLPKSNVPLADFNNAGATGNEIHVEHSTGTTVTSTLSGITIATFTVTMQTKAINVEKGAVKLNITVPVTITAPVKIAENVNTNLVFWQGLIWIISILGGLSLIFWVLLRVIKRN